MHRLGKSLLKMASLVPLFIGRNIRTENDKEQEDYREQELETSINKIFLTSEMAEFSPLKIFAFDAEVLGKQIVNHLDICLGRRVSAKFADGETKIRILDSVRGQRVFIIKSFQNKNINDGIMELMLAVSTMKKEGAESVTAIIPYFPYTTPSNSEDVNEGRDFFTCFGADIVKMLESLGCDEIFTLNSVAASPKGFAQNSRFIVINAPEIAVPYFLHRDLHDPIIVGGRSNKEHLKNLHQMKKTFDIFGCSCQMGTFDRLNYIGDSVKGRDVILFNNLIRKGETLRHQVDILKEQGASRIFCYGFHSIMDNIEFDQLVNELPIEEMVITNTIFHSQQNKKMRIISIAKLLAEVITLLSENKPLNDYREERELLRFAYMQKIRELNAEKKREKEKMSSV